MVSLANITLWTSLTAINQTTKRTTQLTNQSTKCKKLETKQNNIFLNVNIQKKEKKQDSTIWQVHEEACIFHNVVSNQFAPYSEGTLQLSQIKV